MQIRISGKTKITGLFGYPVEHTLSPAMHNAAFNALGIDYCYIPFLVHPAYLQDAVRAIRALNIIGVNITVPHKESVISLLDEVNEEASFTGAINTIVNNGGKLKGYNTDGNGFIRSLTERGISIDGKDVLIVGAGGASRAISYYLCQKAKNLYIYNRTRERAEKLVKDLSKICNSNVSVFEDISHIENFHIIVNATSVGLKDDDPPPIDTSLLKSEQIICDIVYKETRLIKEALKKGCMIIEGSGMLLWQGVSAFELWTGKKPPVDIMYQALRNAIL